MSHRVFVARSGILSVSGALLTRAVSILDIGAALDSFEGLCHTISEGVGAFNSTIFSHLDCRCRSRFVYSDDGAV